jgi:capsular polysaccharide transport system permease protein
VTISTETFDLPAGTAAKPPSPLRVMGRVIYALILRESRTRYGRTMFGYVWAFLTPLAWVALYSFFRLSVDEQPPFGQSIYVWAAGGILIYRLYSSIAGRVTGAVSSNRALLSYPIVNITDMMIARAVLETATMLIVLVFVWALLESVREFMRGVRGVA